MGRLLSSVVILLLIGTTWSTANESYCPPRSEFPCRCQHGNFYISPGTSVICSNINSTEKLKDIVQKLRGYTVDLLWLEYLDIPFLPAGLFTGTWVRNLQISDSRIGNLYSVEEYSPSPFDGLEESLEELHITRTKEPSNWSWPNMKNLKKLKNVEFMQSPLYFVGRVFAEIGSGSLQTLKVSFSNASKIHPQAFSDLKNLSAVEFARNSIVNMSRTMFPNPAPKLTFISLRYNKLDVLPEDMFTNMPALNLLDLSQNYLKTFPEKMYAPLWDQFGYFSNAGNPLTCDCNLRWLRRKMDGKETSFLIQLQLFAVCASPPPVAGLKLSSLSVDQLVC